VREEIRNKQSKIRDRRIESVSGRQLKRHKSVSQRGSARESEEMRIESKESPTVNSEDRLVRSHRQEEDMPECL
jgi:hypothetical protein